jgi:hypothetical protein
MFRMPLKVVMGRNNLQATPNTSANTNTSANPNNNAIATATANGNGKMQGQRDRSSSPKVQPHRKLKFDMEVERQKSKQLGTKKQSDKVQSLSLRSRRLHRVTATVEKLKPQGLSSSKPRRNLNQNSSETTLRLQPQ